MTALTPAQKKEWREQLCVRQTPLEFAECFAMLDGLLEDDALIQSGLDFYRDAYLAKELGNARNAEFIRLLPAARPDFELTIDSEAICYEATEVMKPGRRRAQEFRNTKKKRAAGESTLEDFPFEEWFHDPAEILETLAQRCSKKAEKNYNPETGLVVYLNTNFASENTKLAKSLLCATSVAGRAFREVWVFWGGEAKQIWNRGQPAQ